jgi:predicted kinase
MSTLYIVRGLPGSGKSTYSKSLGCFHIEADMYFVYDGKYEFDIGSISSAHKWCIDIVYNAMFSGADICVSNTFTVYDEIRPYIELCKKFYYDLKIITLTADYGSVHGVPDETIQRMRDRWEHIDGEIFI